MQRQFVHQELVRVVENKQRVKLEHNRNIAHLNNCKEMERIHREREEMETLSGMLDAENNREP